MIVQRKHKTSSPIAMCSESRNNFIPAQAASFLNPLNMPSPSLQQSFEQIPVHAKPATLQSPLKVNTPGDVYEQQADTMADRISDPGSSTQATSSPLKTGTDSGKTIHPELGNRILSSKSNGQRIDNHTGELMSNRFGVDFSQVKIHAGTDAANMNDELQARAFTAGNDIYFNKGEYKPHTQDGKKLLAHELTHVAQQGASTQVQRKEKEKKETESLSDLAATDRKEIQREKGPVKSSMLDAAKLTGLFATDPKLAGGATESISTPGDTVLFSSNIKSLPLKKGFDIQRGLKSVAGFLNSSIQPSALPLNGSISIELDLTSFGGPLSIFRFSYYDKKEGKSDSKELLIELLSATAAAPKNTMPVAGKQFSIGSHSFTLDSGWAQDEYDQLILALSQVPENGLKLVEGLTFKRSADIADDNEAGHYSEANNSITIRNKAFGDDMVRYGTYKFGVQAIVHEIGHAIDFFNTNKAWKEYEKDQDEAKLKKASTLSGEQYTGGAGKDFELKETKLETDFKKAVKQDKVTKGPQSITQYGATDTLENFAEAFSMFITDPDFLKLVRPAIYEFFKKKFKP